VSPWPSAETPSRSSRSLVSCKMAVTACGLLTQ
jgi:hypothetical protein